jgi:AraC family transcriptional regulator, regulatory protein of adaptative response / methylated-DNA-[protein]-cysteine methyltransferase
MFNDEKAWEAISSRDRAKNGSFYYGVITTGVYCLPSCPSKRPQRKNVRFYETAEVARRDGLRPCKRCKPDQDRRQDASVIAVREAARFLQDHAEEMPSLGRTAKQVGLSPFHLHRVFKSLVGLTPKEYLDGLRMKTLKLELKAGGDISQSIYASGFGSTSRVYERITELGMTPSQYRQGGDGVIITYTTITTALGRMLLGATERGLCFLQFGESITGLLAILRKEYPNAVVQPIKEPHHPQLDLWIETIQKYISGVTMTLDLPVAIRASAFQMRVWNYLQSIPYGDVQSYLEVAAAIGAPKATRAVAQACGANHVAMLVPCHRVIQNNGGLGGYKWGLARKRALIDVERSTRAESQRTMIQQAQ